MGGIAEIYGDSIMKGVFFDSLAGKYRTLPGTLFERFAEKFGLQIKNRSRFGCTISKGARMLDNALQKPEPRDFLLMEYGGNDCDFNWKEVAEQPTAQHNPHTPPAAFEQAYRGMVERVKAMGTRPVAMSLPPIDAEKYFQWITRDGLSKDRILQWLGDVQMIYRFQELYSGIITRIAYEMDCLFVDVRSAFLDKHNYKQLLCEDGIHPNEAGHELIYAAFSQKAAAVL